jgi:hypothetical protein
MLRFDWVADDLELEQAANPKAATTTIAAAMRECLRVRNERIDVIGYTPIIRAEAVAAWRR